MKLGIMQPYFFPYLGYFSLIRKSDRFILFDDVQFIRHGWIERNRILKPGEGWQYVAVPLQKFPLGTKINQVVINQSEDWRMKLLRQLEHYKKRSPYYQQTIEVIKDCLDIETDSIVALNKRVLETTCKYVGIQLDVNVFSEMKLEMEPVTHAGEWALNICKSLKATGYVNPTGGKEIFEKKQFDGANISLEFLGNKLEAYSQRRGVFEPGLSIIDTMMFCSPEQIVELIDSTYLV